MWLNVDSSRRSIVCCMMWYQYDGWFYNDVQALNVMYPNQ